VAFKNKVDSVLKYEGVYDDRIGVFTAGHGVDLCIMKQSDKNVMGAGRDADEKLNGQR